MRYANFREEAFMRVFLRCALGLLLIAAVGPVAAQEVPEPARSRFSPREIVDAGQRFFGGVSRELAMIVQRGASQWGLPNGYVLGQEGGGAFIGGLRYGEGVLYTKNAGDLRVIGKGPRSAGTQAPRATGP
jgi:hypothetical protein